MTRQVRTVVPSTEVTQAVQTLIDEDISGVLVVDASGAVVGVLTERDCIAVAVAAGYYDEWGGPVATYMSTPVESVAPDENLVDVAVRMTISRYLLFPVFENGLLLVIISRRDVLRALGKGSWFAKHE
jgi:CBS domain-containing protein